MHEDVLKWIEEQDVKFIRLEFIDLLGQIKNIAIPAQHFEKVLNEGAMFDGSAVEGFTRIELSDMVLFPLPETIMLMPWRPQQGKVARVICEIRTPDGNVFEGDSRRVLKRVIDQARSQGLTFNVGFECEFFLFHTDDEGRPTTKTHDQAGYFDLAPLDYGENTRREVCMVLEEIGFEVEASHHENAAGQHEIDFRYTEGLEAADNLLTFKKVVKIVAQRNGLYATFMPKPLGDASGSGMHINMSLFREGQNLFDGEGSELSPTGKAFIAGVLKHMPGITAISNPLINSYKRLLGAKEAPCHIAWSYMNRTSLIRIPASKGREMRIELRSPDATCNPYLTLALILAAGLEGIAQQLEAPTPIEGNLYLLEQTKDLQLAKLPASLEEAIQAMKSDDFIKKVVGEHIYHKYIMVKEAEIYAYNRQVHQWEIQAYLHQY